MRSNVDEVLTDFLYVGNLCGAIKYESLSSRNIRYIINTAVEMNNQFEVIEIPSLAIILLF